MKFPRLITRRRAKWVALGLSVAFVSLAVISEMTLRGKDRQWMLADDSWVYLGRGFLCVSLPGSEFVRGDWPFEAIAMHIFLNVTHESRSELTSASTWVPRLLPRLYTGKLRVLHLPLAPIALIATLMAAYLWYTDRRAKPWQCAKCRYDLRGLGGVRGENARVDSENRPTVCPECGSVVDHSNRGEASAD